jgi:hypothetical protein
MACRLPPAARRALGFDSAGLSLVPAPRASAEFDVSYPDSPADAVRNASQLWRTDLDDPAALERGKADHRGWNDASLRWLVDPGQMPEAPARGVQIGLSDVERFRVTVDVFATLDDRFGGGHARQALVQYLSSDASRMLNGRYNDAVGRQLFAAVSEAMLLARGWRMTARPRARSRRVILCRRLRSPKLAMTGCSARASSTR